MKKILLPILILASIGEAQAQQVHFGLRAGVSFAKFVGPDAVYNNQEYRTGFNAGALAKVDFSDHWALQPELMYSIKGTKQTFDNSPLYGNGAALYQRLNYVELPVLVKFTTHHVFAEAGPQLGTLVGAKQILEDGFGTEEARNKEQFRTLEVGYVLGLGVQDTNGLLLGVRYNGSFASAYHQDLAAQIRNSAFQIYVGYVFGTHE
ncbi:outer membrane beta-barrel protein [Hymenobacter sp. HMF4947]|uniref:Outer membrane beta-barrel protein n=1 Tax=Hymenobacter ginkgonis TaxID=2682976 RepID=A0A7K1TDN0_9BACT|nr:porin family protein [Hymenobacter ginkgonis]MVN76507.1 outer membrane beta-barrel protein [Hymenobacter ginkgonis]